MSGTKKTKDAIVILLQRVATGLQQQPLAKKTLMLGNESWKVDDIVRLLQNQVAERQAADAALEAWHTAVEQYRATYATQVVPLLNLLRAYVGGTYGMTNAVYKGLGFTQPRKGTPSAETKAAAVTQMRATRKARNTMGKKQRLAVRGTVPAPQSTTPASPSSAPPPSANR